MFKDKNVFFKDLGSVLTSWLPKIHVPFLYMSTHASSGVDSVSCLDYISLNSQSHFFKNINCVLPIPCPSWLPALRRVMTSLSLWPLRSGVTGLHLHLQLLLHSTLSSWPPAIVVSLPNLFLPLSLLLA